MSLRHFKHSLKLRIFYYFIIVINTLNVNQGYMQCYNILNEIKSDKLKKYYIIYLYERITFC